jgi:hypothetical protein
MAELMVAAGAWSAIELDGGGSSTTVIALHPAPFCFPCADPCAQPLTGVQRAPDEPSHMCRRAVSAVRAPRE